jgi:mannose-6-phosphate isomerase
MSPAVELLRTSIQPYAWGSTTAIPAILGEEPTGRPQAEMWIGAHPVAPSRVVRDGVEVALDELVTADPDSELGTDTARRFGRFPFLLKILAAGAPLSLQAHPSAAGARAGFAAEDAAGVARDAPDRNYRDDWPKPEIACALTPFRALAGFRDPARSLPVLQALAAAAPASAVLAGLVEGLRSAVDPAEAIARTLRTVLEQRGEERVVVAGAVVAAARESRGRSDADADLAADLDFVLELAAGYPGDPSVLAALLLNRFTLAPGEAVFLPAGNLHAYLSGTAVELMASSDNVLRGGLTTKHVDVPELLSVLDTTPRPADIVRPVRVSDHEFAYPTPTREFALSRLEVTTDGPARVPDPGGPQLLLCVAGAAVVTGDGPSSEAVVLGSGRAGYARAGCGELVVSGNPAATVFRAVPGDD